MFRNNIANYYYYQCCTEQLVQEYEQSFISVRSKMVGNIGKPT